MNHFLSFNNTLLEKSTSTNLLFGEMMSRLVISTCSGTLHATVYCTEQRFSVAVFFFQKPRSLQFLRIKPCVAKCNPGSCSWFFALQFLNASINPLKCWHCRFCDCRESIPPVPGTWTTTPSLSCCKTNFTRNVRVMPFTRPVLFVPQLRFCDTVKEVKGQQKCRCNLDVAAKNAEAQRLLAWLPIWILSSTKEDYNIFLTCLLITIFKMSCCIRVRCNICGVFYASCQLLPFRTSYCTPLPNQDLQAGEHLLWNKSSKCSYYVYFSRPISLTAH